VRWKSGVEFDTERSVCVGNKIHAKFLSDVKELSRHNRRDLVRPVNGICVVPRLVIRTSRGVGLRYDCGLLLCERVVFGEYGP